MKFSVDLDLLPTPLFFASKFLFFFLFRRQVPAADFKALMSKKTMEALTEFMFDQ